MECLAKYFEGVSAKLLILVTDMEKMVDESQTGKERTKKTIMPLTKFYKDEKEAKNASENPKEAFIEKAIENAFKG